MAEIPEPEVIAIDVFANAGGNNVMIVTSDKIPSNGIVFDFFMYIFHYYSLSYYKDYKT